jgi:hypothetical protein
MHANSSNPANRYRVLLFRQEATELCLETDGTSFRLPQLDLPANTRVAEACNEEALRRWGIVTVCLLARTVSQAGNTIRCVVMEASSSGNAAPAGLCWTSVGSLEEAAFADPLDFSFFSGQCNQGSDGDGVLTLFAKPGSLRTIAEWVKGEAWRAGLRLTGEFRQLNCGPRFSLIRFATDGPALWFKAVGEPNLDEFRVTAELACRFPSYLPRIVGTRPEWNAWLAEEAAGTHLDRRFCLDNGRAAVTALAELQVASLGHGLHLVHAGCRDARVCRLREALGPFLPGMGALMAQQTANPPARLSREELRKLGDQINAALTVLEDSEIPNALGHLDLNPANVLVHETRCVFLDWAEAFVGHPFLALPYLLEHLRRVPAFESTWERDLVDAYANTWRMYFDEERVRSALSVAALLAPFTYALSLSDGNPPPQSCRTERAKLLRSLARRMKREAEAPRERRAICVP